MKSAEVFNFGEPELESFEFFGEVDVGELKKQVDDQGLVLCSIEGIVVDSLEVIEKRLRVRIHGGLLNFFGGQKDLFRSERFFFSQSSEHESFGSQQSDLTMDAGGVLIDCVNGIRSKERLRAAGEF